MDGQDFQQPGVLIVAEAAVHVEGLRTAAASCDARILGQVGFEQALEAVNQRASVDALLIALPETPDWGQMQALIDHRRCLIEVTDDTLDIAWGLLSPADATWVVGSSNHERCVALADLLTASPRPASVAESDAVEFRRLSEEAGRIAALLETLALNADAAEPSLPPTAPRLRALLRARRLRDRYFAPGLFADPAWDMMIDLMAARIEGGEVSISSLCIAAAVPPTTALRWIREMLHAGLFVRHDDPADRRRAFVTLSEPAADTLALYFAELDRQGLPTL